MCLQKIGRVVYFLKALKLSFNANDIYKVHYEYTFLIMRRDCVD